MWKDAKAPSLAEMEAMAHEIFEHLPKRFRDLCEGVIIRVDDFPTDEVLDEMNAESEFDLLGLFQGVGLPFRSNDDVARLPNMVGYTAGRSWITGPNMRRRWAISSATCWFTRSVTILGYPTTIWRRSRRPQVRPICPLIPGAFAINPSRYT